MDIDITDHRHRDVLFTLAHTGNVDAFAIYNARFCYQHPIPAPKEFEELYSRRYGGRRLRIDMETALVVRLRPVMSADAWERWHRKREERLRDCSTINLVWHILKRWFGVASNDH